MDASAESLPFAAFVEAFRRHGVEFIVIGGQAEILHGGARVTFDCDFAYRRTPENIQRLAAALETLRPRLRGAPPDVPFRVDAKTLANGSNFTFETAYGPLDLLGWVEPFGEYDAFVGRAEAYIYEGKTLLVMALDDLIRIKRHINRPKDQASLAELLAIKQEREGGAA
ncbi:MAG: hypothetical protein KIS87_07350 [Phycisphaeraceae bacterium]|nr:hypothetical protein [Phycisphaeraceae bacterium]